MQFDARGNSKATSISVANLEEMVGGYHHHLLCLEADLNDRARAGVISSREFSKRIQKLKEVQSNLNTLRKFAIADQPGPLADSDIGLPLLDHCTPAEKETCERSMLEKELELLRIEGDLSKVHKWTREAVAGKSGSLRLTLRLSKLRRLIHSYSKLTTQAEAEQATIDVSAEDLIKHMKSRKAAVSGRTLLQGLMDLFLDLEKSIARVAKLRTTLRQETIKVSEMKAWLRQEEQRFRSGHAIRKPPTPLQLARSSIFNMFTPQSTNRRSERRRALIEQFWSDIITTRNALPETSDLSIYTNYNKPLPTEVEPVRSEAAPIKQSMQKAKPSNDPYLPHPSRKVRSKRIKKGKA